MIKNDTYCEQDLYLKSRNPICQHSLKSGPETRDLGPWDPRTWDLRLWDPGPCDPGTWNRGALELGPWDLGLATLGHRMLTPGTLEMGPWHPETKN